jgi:mono/diheme cytochrome c family protein
MSTKIFALAMLAGGLVACGGGDAAPADDATVDAPAAAPAAAVASAGATEYTNNCSVCHQADGNGMPGAFPPLAGSSIVNAPSPDQMIMIVLKGLQGPVTVNGVEYNGIMTPFQDILTDDQIASILTYERASFGNTGSAVTAEQVAAIRAQYADKTDSWTIESLEAAMP